MIKKAVNFTAEIKKIPDMDRQTDRQYLLNIRMLTFTEKCRLIKVNGYISYKYTNITTNTVLKLNK